MDMWLSLQEEEKPSYSVRESYGMSTTDSLTQV